MLSRFSVKRPYVIIVAVIVSLILGGVSMSKMKTDLLPDMEMPYLAVITTDPGASAEKVESDVTNVLEGSLSTVSGVSEVQSISSDNFSMVFLTFEDGTNMDSAMVKVSSAVNEVQSSLPEAAGTPNLMELSMDMMATMYLAAVDENHDIYETSALVEDTLVPAIERVDGVADASTTGSVEKSVEVRLDDDKIEQINNKLLAYVNDELYDAKKEIDEGKAQIKKAKKQLEKAKEQISEKETETYDQLGQADGQLTSGIAGMTSMVSAYSTQVATLQAQIQALEAQKEAAATEEEQAALQAQIDALSEQLESANTQLSEAQSQLKELQDAKAASATGGYTAVTGFADATAQITTTEASLSSSEASLKQAEEQYKEARESALKNANIDKLVDKATLSQLIAAQNFSMPAGYVDDENDNQWLLRVGDTIDSADELEDLLLTKLDGVGKIRLGDVATITVVDNVGESYMKVNGIDGVLISVYKNSTASTSEVSDNVHAAIDKLEADNEGLTLSVMMDQGSAIDIYIRTILQSLLLGALLAIIVLAVFLRDWKPTVIVAFSIPFSVLLALLIMYFTGIDLNIMSMGGLSLAIGMLVDNSVVVMENIYRLRARGMTAARAAVQGAKQMAAPVVASTLTTICVFLPIIFTTGMVNQLLLPFALTIAYVLCASLVVALTLVPAVASMVFKKDVRPNPGWFEHVQNGYAKALNWSLNHKVVPLLLASVLLVGSIYGVINMGITMIPTMTSKTISMSLSLEEGTEREEAYAIADEIMARAMEVDGFKLVGAMDGTASVSSVSAAASSSNSDRLATRFSIYAQTDPEKVTTEDQVVELRNQLKAIAADVTGQEVDATSSDSSMSSMLGSGLSITIAGRDMDKLVAISEDVMAAIDEVEGYTEIENGMEDADKELHLVIDRDKLTNAGYTVAQLYADLSSKLTTEASATEIAMDKYDVDVTIVDETNLVTKENLMNTEFEIAKTTADGTETKTYKLKDFATIEETVASDSVNHVDGERILQVTADVEEGYNNALLSRELQEKLDAIELPDGYSLSTGGELENIQTMLEQMLLLLLLGFVLIYLIMVAQFQGLLSPFIILFTVPLAFTGGFLGLLFAGEQLSMLALLGFAVLMGTVVNNGIVFVDYANQLRIGGLEKRDALIATGRTRMRPILMTALTTILAMCPMVFSTAIGASMERGMALVVAGGLLYATFTTLFIVPIIYDLLCRRPLLHVDLDEEGIDEDPGDAADYLAALKGAHAAAVTAPIAVTAGAHGVVSEEDRIAEAEEVGFERKPKFMDRFRKH